MIFQYAFHLVHYCVQKNPFFISLCSYSSLFQNYFNATYSSFFGFNRPGYQVVLLFFLSKISFIYLCFNHNVFFTGLKGQTLYPIVSAVWGHCEVTMRYRICGEAGPSPLSHWCRRTIRRRVGANSLEAGAAQKLGLPNPIRDFILHR